MISTPTSENIFSLIIFIVILILLRIYFVNLGKLSFWKLAAIYLNDFFDHMENNPAWYFSSSQITKPSADYVGPFYFERLGVIYTIFAHKDLIEESQKDFIKKYSPKLEKKPFPLISFIGLSYPLMAMLSITNSSWIFCLGYGLSNLAYLLIFSGVIAGSFRALGLDHRIQVFVASLAFLIPGVILVNL